MGRIRSRVLAREPGTRSMAPDGPGKDFSVEAASSHLAVEEGLTGPQEPAPRQAEANSLPHSRCPAARGQHRCFHFLPVSFALLSGALVLSLPFQAERIKAD